jgi:hypothetical protein
MRANSDDTVTIEPVAILHARPDGGDHVDAPAQKHVQEALPQCVVGELKDSVNIESRAADRHVDRPEVVLRRLDRLGHRHGVGDIQVERHAVDLIS